MRARFSRFKNVVIYGPPGTGKTRMLIEETAGYLASRPDARILFCSHTRAAAMTGIERWGQKSGRIDIQTLHSFCFRTMKYGRDQTVEGPKLEHFVEGFGLDMEDGGDGKRYVEIINYAGSCNLDPMEAYMASSRPGNARHFESFSTSYLDWKKQMGYVDFNDMLRGYLKHNDTSGYNLLVVDEAQDLTPLQWQIIRRFLKLNAGCKAYIAGDDDQCIYSYAGAYPHGMDEFATDTNAKVIVLEKSHRIPKAVHTLAEGVISNVERRVAKAYQPREEQGEIIPMGYADEMKIDPAKDTLVLYADRYVRKDVEQHLIDLRVPFTATGGFPAPLQTRAAQAIKACHNGNMSEQDIETMRRALHTQGQDVYRVVGPEMVAQRIREGDYSLLKMHWSIADYLAGIDWSAPIKCRISTIHGAKGMEAEDVHLVTAQSQSAVEHSLRDPDAQHRLMYVGVTRASQRLFTYEGDNAYNLSQF